MLSFSHRQTMTSVWTSGEPLIQNPIRAHHTPQRSPTTSSRVALRSSLTSLTGESQLEWISHAQSSVLRNNNQVSDQFEHVTSTCHPTHEKSLYFTHFSGYIFSKAITKKCVSVNQHFDNVTERWEFSLEKVVGKNKLQEVAKKVQ